MKPISTKPNKTSANKKSATNQPAMASQNTYQHNAHLPTLSMDEQDVDPYVPLNLTVDEYILRLKRAKSDEKLKAIEIVVKCFLTV
jgi:hypothetical protein